MLAINHQDSEKAVAIGTALKYLQEWTNNFDSFVGSPQYETMKSWVQKNTGDVLAQLRDALDAFIALATERSIADDLHSTVLKETIDTNDTFQNMRYLELLYLVDEEEEITTLLAEADKIVQSMYFRLVDFVGNFKSMDDLQTTKFFPRTEIILDLEGAAFPTKTPPQKTVVNEGAEQLGKGSFAIIHGVQHTWYVHYMTETRWGLHTKRERMMTNDPKYQFIIDWHEGTGHVTSMMHAATKHTIMGSFKKLD